MLERYSQVSSNKYPSYNKVIRKWTSLAK